MIAVGRRWFISNEVPLAFAMDARRIEEHEARLVAGQMEMIGKEVWAKLLELCDARGKGDFLVMVQPIHEGYNGPRKEGSRVVDITRVQVEYSV